MAGKMPNPFLGGYRTAHKQNKDGSYGLTVMPADLIRLPCRKPDTSRLKVGGMPFRSGLHESSPAIEACSEVEGRQISARMEEAYRLRHHDFGGKTTIETALIMGIKPHAVDQLLWRMCKLAPQLFPILTPSQARAWHLWHHEGMSHSMIADAMGISVNAARQLVKRAKKRLDYCDVLGHRLIVMDPRQLEKLELDKEIVQVF